MYQKKVDFVLVILSVIIPVVGYFLFVREKLGDNYNNVAITYLIAGIGGTIVSLLILLNI